MPRYVLLDHKSVDRATGKFWEITLKGNVISMRTGKVGPSESRIDGRTHSYNDPGRAFDRSFPDREAARRKYESMIAAKCTAGYQLVDGFDPTAPEVTAHVHRHLDLEAAIAAAPDDVATYLVYADWLESQGDRRCELIRMQHAMRVRPDPSTFMAYKKRDEELRHSHGRVWLGPVVVECSYRVRLDWRLGFVESARLDDRQNASEVELASLVAALLDSPAGCLVRKLALRGVDEALDAALGALPFAGLQRVSVLSRGGSDAAQQLVQPHRARLAAANVAIEVGYYER